MYCLPTSAVRRSKSSSGLDRCSDRARHPVFSADIPCRARSIRELRMLIAHCSPEGDQLSDLAREYIELIASLGTRIIHLSAEQHDRLVAWTSHLPQMLSTAFAAVLQDEAELEQKAHVTRSQMQDVGGRAL